MKSLLKKTNNKSKAAARYFFTATKIGLWIMGGLAAFNAIEGIVHLVTAAIGTWGAVDVQVWDIRVWFPIIENFFTGVLSLVTAWALGIQHHHHGDSHE